MNKRGIAISSIIYAILILFLALVAGILSLLGNRKLILDKFKNNVINKLNNIENVYVQRFGGTLVLENNKTYIGIAYLNPIDLTATCTEALATANTNEYGAYTGINTGCLKFYIYDEDSENNTYTMILDHNTSGNVAWNSNNTNTEMLEVKERLEEDTKNWVGNPRLITETEVRTITNNTGTSDYYFGSGNTTGYSSQTAEQKVVQQSYAWLFNNLYQSTNYGGSKSDDNQYSYGTKTSLNKSTINGYWTSSSLSNSSSNVWYIYRLGILSYYDRPANHVVNLGVRPVITLLKSDLSND